ncbi:hypothetical protein L1987_16302 [Smallanthus sonchifolius]|uniref:Uncharacterized protein n=1 Tax=Smallanthus sonchifolius TaxID=185202 RepID=A0ACB9J8F9_9ASTR|nr:hypothetical protein L1987_16302 [Smallanthus sonchifolius]
MGYNSDVLNRIDAALAYLVGGNGEYFRGGDFGSIQGMAQCVQDLSLSDCQDCLQEASGRLRSECETSTCGDMYLGKCYIQYADQGNVNLPNNGNPTPNNNNPTPNKKNKRRGRRINWKSFLQWTGIVISVLTSTGGTVSSHNIANSAKSEAKSAKFRVSTAEEKADTAKGTAEKAIKKAENTERNVEDLNEIVSMYIIPPADNLFSQSFFSRGQLLLPIYKQIVEMQNAEIFSANTLLVILGTSLLTSRAGLSIALGAFLAGLLLVETEFSLQVESDVAPYCGLLLGHFFMTVESDPKLLVLNLPLIMGSLGLLIAGKTILVAFVGPHIVRVPY